MALIWLLLKGRLSRHLYINLAFNWPSINVPIQEERVDGLAACTLAPTMEKVATFLPDTHYHLCKISCWSLEYAFGSRTDICTVLVQYLLRIFDTFLGNLCTVRYVREPTEFERSQILYVLYHRMHLEWILLWTAPTIFPRCRFIYIVMNGAE